MLSALYYPFSRCINAASLKQLLLVFESIHFVDPVDDDEWRAKLFKDLERAWDPSFSLYRQVHDAWPILAQERAVVRHDPADIIGIGETKTSAAVLSDLEDPLWSSIASSPAKYLMPHGGRESRGAPSWQIFPTKIPRQLINIFNSHPDYRPHIIAQQGLNEAWTLSYAAGSAVAMNTHLAAAEELSLAPVTDSKMHAQLLDLKLTRWVRTSRSESERHSGLEHTTANLSVSLLREIVSHEDLCRLDFEGILRFRSDTREVRRQFTNDLSKRISAATRGSEAVPLDQIVQAIRDTVVKEVKDYRDAMTASRDRIWPKLIDSVQKEMPKTSLAAIGMNYIGGPGYALAASILATSLSILKVSLEEWAEQRKLQRSASPPVAYFSRIHGIK